METYEQRKKWFIDRIGKVIFRDADSCECQVCKDVVENGLTVHDEYHAIYLADIEGDYAASGVMLNYRDSKI